jgi:hypothetical protein
LRSAAFRPLRCRLRPQPPRQQHPERRCSHKPRRTNGKKKKKGKGYGPTFVQAGQPGVDLCMGVMEGKRADTRLLVRGEIDQPSETVPRGFVNVLTNGEAPKIPPTDSGRLQLADWLVSPTNPLTARVAVNRVWSESLWPGPGPHGG